MFGALLCRVTRPCLSQHALQHRRSLFGLSLGSVSWAHTDSHSHTWSHLAAARARRGQLIAGHVTCWVMHRTDSSSRLRAPRQICGPATAASRPAPPLPLCHHALPPGTLLAAWLYLAQPAAATSTRRHMLRCLSYFLPGATVPSVALTAPTQRPPSSGRPHGATDAAARHGFQLSGDSRRRQWPLHTAINPGRGAGGQAVRKGRLGKMPFVAGRIMKGERNVAADTPSTHMRSPPPPPASCGSADPIAAAERLLRCCGEAARQRGL